MKPLKHKVASSLTLLFLLSAIHLASAFYDPNLGRWINRDPLADRGFITLKPRITNGRADQNLSRFVSNEPMNQVDSFGLLLGWGYGNWCGFDRYGQNGEPIDQVDNACKDHDNCIPTVPSFFTPCRAKICNQLFCLQVALADCANSPNPEGCRGARTDILTLCALTQLGFPGGLP